MKDILGVILDNSKDFNDFKQSAEKQGYTIKPSFVGVYKQYKKEQKAILNGSSSSAKEILTILPEHINV